MPSVFWFVGGNDPKTYATAKAAGKHGWQRWQRFDLANQFFNFLEIQRRFRTRFYVFHCGSPS